MTTRAQKLSEAIQKVSWDWGSMEQSHPHKIAIASLRFAAERLCTDWGELQHPCDILNEIADELEELK